MVRDTHPTRRRLQSGETPAGPARSFCLSRGGGGGSIWALEGWEMTLLTGLTLLTGWVGGTGKERRRDG